MLAQEEDDLHASGLQLSFLQLKMLYSGVKRKDPPAQTSLGWRLPLLLNVGVTSWVVAFLVFFFLSDPQLFCTLPGPLVHGISVHFACSWIMPFLVFVTLRSLLLFDSLLKRRSESVAAGDSTLE